jgi:RNA polymerase sigma-70 factor (ECF subfamily)
VEPVTQAQLVERARGGDREAFARLYREHVRAVHAVLLARLPEPQDADDALQDVFEAALARLCDLREPRAFPGWLLTIARNRASDGGRRRGRVVTLAREPRANPPPRLEAREALEMIRSLPQAYRETLLMRLVAGMSGPEIAEATGLRPLSVRVNLHRGMKLLRERLQEGTS